MSKIDCSNIINFFSEWERRNKAKDSTLSIKDMGYELYIHDRWKTSLEEGLKKWVDDLQRWSDEHPQITRKEKFIKLCQYNGFADELEKNFAHCGYPMCVGDCDSCKEHWNEVIE